MGKIQKVKLGIIGLLLTLAGWLLGGSLPAKLGGAPAGLYTSYSTTSQATIGPQERLAFLYPLTDCTSRVISTVGSAIMLSFNTSSSTATSTVSGTQGVVQAASTTVAYDSEIYGCGVVAGLGFASTTISIIQFK